MLKKGEEQILINTSEHSFLNAVIIQLCICTNCTYFVYTQMTVLICKKPSNSFETKTDKEGRKMYCFTQKRILVQLDVAEKSSKFYFQI